VFSSEFCLVAGVNLMAYTEHGAVAPLKDGRTVEVRGTGNSMTPLISSGQVVLIEPLKADASLNRGDIVLAKVRGRVYLHLVRALRGDQVQIANNHGHVNGWTPRAQIYGRLKR
jgi:phage repressor protein C with HTH and peptisase S24 domain